MTTAHHDVGDQLFVDLPGRRHPLLESAAADRPPRRFRTAWFGAMVAVTPVTVIMAIMMWFADGDRVQGYLILAAVSGGGTVIWFFLNVRDVTVVLRAGAHAVALVDGYGIGTALSLYELRSIRMTASALRLVGRTTTSQNQQRITIPFGLLEANQQLWDLVYNGMLHSAAAGAELDAGTRRLLRLG